MADLRRNREEGKGSLWLDDVCWRVNPLAAVHGLDGLLGVCVCLFGVNYSAALMGRVETPDLNNVIRERSPEDRRKLDSEFWWCICDVQWNAVASR